MLAVPSAADLWNRFSGYDLAALAVVAVFFFRSFFRGAAREFFSLLALSLGFLAAVSIGDIAAGELRPLAGDASWTLYLAYPVVFVLTWLAVKVVGWLVIRIWRFDAPGFWSRLAGGVFGGLKAVVLLAAAVLLLESRWPALELPSAGAGMGVTPWIRSVGRYMEEVAGRDGGGILGQVKSTVRSAAQGLRKSPVAGSAGSARP